MKPVRLFFSHSSKDDVFGRRLVADLRAHLGEDAVWYDVSGGLHGGDEWWNRIVAEITARDTFLVLFSPDALTSDWVPREMGIAYWQHVKLGKRLMPLMHRACEMPADWQLIQALPFTDDLPYEARLTSLLTELGYTGVVTPLTFVTTRTVTVPTSIAVATETPKERLVTRLTQEVHTAFGRENWSQALLRARTLHEEAPEAMTPQLWRELGLAAIEIEDGATALAALDLALSNDPYDVPTLRGKAQALVMLDQPEEARKLLERAQSYIPLDEKESQIELLTELIGILDEQDRPEEVLEAYNHVLALDPANADAWNGKGEALYELERYLPALSAFNRALSLNMNATFFWFNKGNALFAIERDEEALAAYEQALSLDSKWASVWISKGDSLFNLERYKEALEAYEQALSLDPSNGDVWSDKGDALLNLERYKEALEAYEQALIVDPEDTDTWGKKGNILYNLERYEEALEAYEQALALDPEIAEVWYNKSLALKKIGHAADAQMALQRAQEINKDVGTSS